MLDAISIRTDQSLYKLFTFSNSAATLHDNPVMHRPLKSGTSRKAPLLLNEENSITLARYALRDFGYDADTVPLTFVKMRENCVFRADTPEGSIALRLHRPGYRTALEISAESEFIEVLAERGFPVVRLVPTLAGNYTTTVRAGGVEVVVDAQRWVEDAQMLGSSEGSEENDGLAAEHFESMGELAARMHHVAEELSGQRSFPRAPWDAEGIIGEQALWGDALSVPSLSETDEVLLRRTRRRVLDELARFGTAPTVYGSIHADFTPENLLVSGDDLIVIDFDDFGEGWYLFDLATALFFFLEHEHYEQFRAGLLRGYRGVRELGAEEERLLDVFLVARGFTYLGWAATRPGTDTAEFVVADVVPLVLRLAAELETV